MHSEIQWLTLINTLILDIVVKHGIHSFIINTAMYYFEMQGDMSVNLYRRKLIIFFLFSKIP